MLLENTIGFQDLPDKDAISLKKQRLCFAQNSKGSPPMKSSPKNLVLMIRNLRESDVIRHQ